jgi:hypothetical protein
MNGLILDFPSVPNEVIAAWMRGFLIALTIPAWFGILFGFSHSIVMGLTMLAFTAIMFGVVEGQILIPCITGRAVHVHLLFVLAGLLTGAELLGLPGALFAPALTSVRDVIARAVGDVSLPPSRGVPAYARARPPTPLIPGVAPTDPEAFLPEVIGEAAAAMEGKAEQKT